MTNLILHADLPVCEAKKAPLARRRLVLVLCGDGLRLMRKFNLFAKIRRANPYKQLAKTTQEHTDCPNREFEHDEPGKVFVTNITYLPNRSRQMVYLSAVKDGANREVVAYGVTTTLTMEIVYRTLKKLKEALDGNVQPEAMIHSDQGFHYTHPECQMRLKELGLTQSMSRRSNCIDNAPWNRFLVISRMMSILSRPSAELN